MNYNNPELRDVLAGEYVLGTLRGKARARFERLLAMDASLRDRVERWEVLLAAPLTNVEPLEPPGGVWRKLASKIGAQDTDS